MGDGLLARQVALAALDQVVARRQPLDQFLDQSDTYRELETRDRAFVRMLTSTVFRRRGQLDDLIAMATESDKPPSPLRLHNLLRLGAAQIAFMDTADYAVVDTSVTLADSVGLARQKGLVNAVLRRIAREGGARLAQQGAWLNIPAWLQESWTADYGADIAGAIAQASLAEAPLDLTLRDPAACEHFASLLEAKILPTGTLRLAGGPVPELPGFAEGAWWVQDAAASLPAHLFGDIAGRTVYDLCAAPGGKTAQLAAAGADVVALDRSAARLPRLRENMARLGLEARVTAVAGDAESWTPPAPADFILLDAPCTATGTIRRHPDLLMLKTAADVARLAATQSRLLDRAAAQLAPGGVLIYCTCSVQKAEGEDQIEALLTRQPDLRRVPVAAAEIGNLADAITPGGDVRLLPFHLAASGGIDGFFIARLARRGT